VDKAFLDGVGWITLLLRRLFDFLGVLWSYLFFLFGHSGNGMVISEHNSYTYYPEQVP
jgi:bacteriorhodopsin